MEGALSGIEGTEGGVPISGAEFAPEDEGASIGAPGGAGAGGVVGVVGGGGVDAAEV